MPAAGRMKFGPVYGSAPLKISSVCLGRRVIFNIHIKGASDNANAAAQGGHSFQKRHMEQVVSLIRKYDCEDWCYIAGDSDILQLAIQVDESIQRCSLCGCFDYTIVDAAIKYGCKKLRF